MPVVIVATLTAKPESVDTLRDILSQAAKEVHEEPGCQLYSLHEAGESFVLVEQWADEEALKTHMTAPAIGKLFSAAGAAAGSRGRSSQRPTTSVTDVSPDGAASPGRSMRAP